MSGPKHDGYRLSVNAIARASHLLATLCIRPATTTLEEEHTRDAMTNVANITTTGDNVANHGMGLV